MVGVVGVTWIIGITKSDAGSQLTLRLLEYYRNEQLYRFPFLLFPRRGGDLGPNINPVIRCKIKFTHFNLNTLNDED